MRYVGLREVAFLLSILVPLGIEAATNDSNPYDSGHFEGDIILDQNTSEIISQGLLSGAFVPAGVGSDDPYYLWPNDVLYYMFDSSIGSSLQTLIQSAMQDISSETCIQFTIRSTENDYVKFTQGQGCHSYVGRKGGEQIISLGTGCHTKGIILHEIMHSLGFFHTHTRPDRNSYIRVNYNNINSADEIYFKRYSTSQVTTQGSPYDFKSILHLPKIAFSNNGQNTMEARMDSSMQLGQAVALTDIDIQIMNDLYQCGIPGCYHALVGTDIVPDSQFSSSSELLRFYDYEARLHNRVSTHAFGSWCPRLIGDPTPWLQINFGGNVTIKSMATQGRDIPYFSEAYVKSLILEYTYDTAGLWTQYAQTITGNFDTRSVQYTDLNPAISAQYVRIKPQTWQVRPCMRVEFFGCSS